MNPAHEPLAFPPGVGGTPLAEAFRGAAAAAHGGAGARAPVLRRPAGPRGAAGRHAHAATGGLGRRRGRGAAAGGRGRRRIIIIITPGPPPWPLDGGPELRPAAVLAPAAAGVGDFGDE